MKDEIRIGVDTGGTFTDFVIYAHGKTVIKKIPSTPKNPSLAILKGIAEFLEENSSSWVVHGTTMATNSLLERKGGPIAIITTKGFEDILSIGRQTRRRVYSLQCERRSPILSRRLCFGLEERTSSSGRVEKKISLPELKKIIAKIQKAGVKAVAISLINSYANSSNEKSISRELQKKKILTSASCDILPEYREYERTATTAVNAYLLPVISRYLESLGKKMPRTDLRIMQSNEGHITLKRAKSEPLRTALSGPAGGVVGAFNLAKAAGIPKMITLDMGGTSSDVSLIDGGIRRTNESMIGDFPVRIPIIDIHSVGAGGGSIAYLDRGGSLRVGPQSAGADPGPACYGQGKLPTVTDANLVLGRLVPDLFLGGKMKIYPQKSRKVLEDLAKKIGKSLLETAEGIIEIANANMEKAIRVISIERGFDPRTFILFSFGGAGGMHAVEIASYLKMQGVIIPKNAGVLSALGLLLADSIKDYSQSLLKTTDKISERELENRFNRLCLKGINDLKADGFHENEICVYPFLDLRYLGQSYELTIPYQQKRGPHLSFTSEFHRAHKKFYSYRHEHRPVEIVNIRVKAVGEAKKIRLRRLPPGNKNPEKAYLKKNNLYYLGKKYQASVFDRSLLMPGNRLSGPSLIVDGHSTTFLPPFYALEVDGYQNLLIQKEGRRRG